jgi:hypothetical protein
MWTRLFVAALAPLLLAAVPLVAQQPPPKPKPTTPAPPAPKPTTAPKPAAAPAPAPAPAAAQAASATTAVRAISQVGKRRPEIEATGGVGYSIVDLGSWAGEGIVSNSKLAYWGAGRVFFPVGTSISVGVEVGYHYHFWWTTPSMGYSWVYTYDAAAAHAAVLLRLPLSPSFTADVGPAMHFFSGGTKPGVVGALMYHIPVGPSINIPVGVRADAIFTSPILIPVVLSAGVGIKL